MVATDCRAEHLAACAEFSRRVDDIQPDQWHLPTPCTSWTVADLVSHVVRNHLYWPRLLAGERAHVIATGLDAWSMQTDGLPDAWREASQATIDAFAVAPDLSLIVPLAFGQTLLEDAIGFVADDVLIHTWDLAHAVAAPDRLPIRLLAATYRRTQAHADLLRASGELGPPLDVPAEADLQELTLALFGRRM